MVNVKELREMEPWEWPRNAGKLFQRVLRDANANPEERLIAAELAGDFTVINDQLAGDLMAIVRNAGESPEIRAQAAISFGPALEAASIGDFDDADEVPI